MFHVPEYYHDLSLKLSEVLDDIGVNETLVMKQRKTILLLEIMKAVTLSSSLKTSVLLYHFGSQSEGTTSKGLNSDLDSLICCPDTIVIQDFSDWQSGLLNLLMVKDENTPPGYCQLQLVRNDIPLPEVCVENEHCVKVGRDRVLLKNTFLKYSFKDEHGPSNVVLSVHGEMDQDFVPAFLCKAWPIEAKQWFYRGGANIWPTQEIKNFAETSDCFVVPVGSKVSQNEVLEWRISTSIAERSLMLNLNITQIRCYILMKMILITYLNSHLSSFMCKTVLLYCIEKTQPNLWTDFNLMKCLSHCLQRLYTSLIERNCPHFIIPGNNLMAGKFSVQVKNILQEKLCHIIESYGHALFGIQIDNLGKRLQIKLNMLHHPVQTHLLTKYELSISIPFSLLLDMIRHVFDMHDHILVESLDNSSVFIQHELIQRLHLYTKVYRNGNKLEKIASSLLVPSICSTLGTITASLNLQTNERVSSKAVKWLHAGLNSDVSSGRLKLASVMYSVGDMVSTEVILRELERKYDRQAVEPACRCHFLQYSYLKRQFAEEIYFKDIVYATRENISLCVRFTPGEINCIPHELRYEMFRSTQEDLLHRDMDMDSWMDCAVIDSLPYLYFLQYKTYGQLQRLSDQQQAFNNLTVSIETERNLHHIETALNLFGQCMEKENRIQDALNCYTRSLQNRNTNNVARIHICKLLANIVNHVQD